MSIVNDTQGRETARGMYALSQTSDIDAPPQLVEQDTILPSYEDRLRNSPIASYTKEPENPQNHHGGLTNNPSQNFGSHQQEINEENPEHLLARLGAGRGSASPSPPPLEEVKSAPHYPPEGYDASYNQQDDEGEDDDYNGHELAIAQLLSAMKKSNICAACRHAKKGGCGTSRAYHYCERHPDRATSASSFRGDAAAATGTGASRRAASSSSSSSSFSKARKARAAQSGPIPAAFVVEGGQQLLLRGSWPLSPKLLLRRRRKKEGCGTGELVRWRRTSANDGEGMTTTRRREQLAASHSNDGEAAVMMQLDDGKQQQKYAVASAAAQYSLAGRLSSSRRVRNQQINRGFHPPQLNGKSGRSTNAASASSSSGSVSNSSNSKQKPKKKRNRISQRCEACRRAKKGYCGTDRAHRHCLRLPANAHRRNAAAAAAGGGGGGGSSGSGNVAKSRPLPQSPPAFENNKKSGGGGGGGSQHMKNDKADEKQGGGGGAAAAVTGGANGTDAGADAAAVAAAALSIISGAASSDREGDEKKQEGGGGGGGGEEDDKDGDDVGVQMTARTTVKKGITAAAAATASGEYEEEGKLGVGAKATGGPIQQGEGTFATPQRVKQEREKKDRDGGEKEEEQEKGGRGVRQEESSLRKPSMEGGGGSSSNWKQQTRFESESIAAMTKIPTIIPGATTTSSSSAKKKKKKRTASKRCKACIRLKKGYCGTERAVARCLRRQQLLQANAGGGTQLKPIVNNKKQKLQQQQQQQQQSAKRKAGSAGVNSSSTTSSSSSSSIVDSSSRSKSNNRKQKKEHPKKKATEPADISFCGSDIPDYLRKRTKKRIRGGDKRRRGAEDNGERVDLSKKGNNGDTKQKKAKTIKEKKAAAGSTTTVKAEGGGKLNAGKKKAKKQMIGRAGAPGQGGGGGGVKPQVEVTHWAQCEKYCSDPEDDYDDGENLVVTDREASSSSSSSVKVDNSKYPGAEDSDDNDGDKLMGLHPWIRRRRKLSLEECLSRDLTASEQFRKAAQQFGAATCKRKKRGEFSIPFEVAARYGDRMGFMSRKAFRACKDGLLLREEEAERCGLPDQWLRGLFLAQRAKAGSFLFRFDGDEVTREKVLSFNNGVSEHNKKLSDDMKAAAAAAAATSASSSNHTNGAGGSALAVTGDRKKTTHLLQVGKCYIDASDTMRFPNGLLNTNPGGPNSCVFASSLYKHYQRNAPYESSRNVFVSRDCPAGTLLTAKKRRGGLTSSRSSSAPQIRRRDPRAEQRQENEYLLTDGLCYTLTRAHTFGKDFCTEGFVKLDLEPCSGEWQAMSRGMFRPSRMAGTNLKSLLKSSASKKKRTRKRSSTDGGGGAGSNGGSGKRRRPLTKKELKEQEQIRQVMRAVYGMRNLKDPAK
eukprot:jgi/Bigna1/72579/fgenesh1_pg.20_\